MQYQKNKRDSILGQYRIIICFNIGQNAANTINIDPRSKL